MEGTIVLDTITLNIWLAFRALGRWITKTTKAFIAWFGPVAGSIAGRVNWRELIRVAIVAASSGTLVGAIQAFLANWSTIVVDPGLATAVSLGATGMAFMIEHARRRAQGAHLSKPSGDK